MRIALIRAGFFSVLACASLNEAFAAPTYTLTDLGTGGASDINASGKVVGSDSAGGWYFDGTTRTTLHFKLQYANTPPGPPPYSLTAATVAAINDSGQIVGDTYFAPPSPPALNGYSFNAADLNSVGLLLGPNMHPHGINAHGDLALANANDINDSVWNAINDSGLLAGSIGAVGAAASSLGGTATLLDLSALDMQTFRGPTSAALSVNNAGQLVGYATDWKSRLPVVPSLAFLYANGSAVSLGTLGGVRAVAKDINNAGIVVGTSSLANEELHAIVYVNGTLADLNALVSAGGAGWVLTSANAVNDSGVIVGEGTKDGVAHAFMLTPAADNLPPTVSLPPVGTNVFAGESFTLRVAAIGSGTLTYQWQHAGTNVPGATGVTYSVAHATPDDAGSYRVLVSNASGTTPSDSATVVVKVLAELHLALYAGITVTGPVGASFRIEAVDHVGDTDWQPLGNVTLATATYFWVDTDSPQHPGRFYRAVPLP
jgi:probable HAF family extracellular repeat protein